VVEFLRPRELLDHFMTDRRKLSPSFRGRFGRVLAHVLALVVLAWAFELAIHVHSADSHGTATSQASHLCQLCAGSQAGVAPALAVMPVALGLPSQAEALETHSVLLTGASSAYQSRAPPTA
jgi:hypothetical protein